MPADLKICFLPERADVEPISGLKTSGLGSVCRLDTSGLECMSELETYGMESSFRLKNTGLEPVPDRSCPRQSEEG